MQTSATTTLFLMAAMTTGACTHWTVSPTYGPRQEVARHLVGAPQIEETTSSDVSGGFAAGGWSNGRRSHSHGLFGGDVESVRRTHCVQQAQVDYVQRVDYVPHVARRPLDVGGAIMLGVAGLAVIGIANAAYHSDESFYEMDPSFFSKPSTPTVAYGIGGAGVVGAGIWLAYSLTALPKGPPPAMAPQQRAWTETTYVEATGCGLVPADRAPPPPAAP